jgi:glutamate dehydrogenase (NADP+)
MCVVCLQAVEEITQSLLPLFQRDPKLLQVWKVMLEPERVIQFRVCWQDDEGDWRTNRGYRVQYNSAIGPYKGGLRFHPSVNLSILKFLGLEQILKNSLTTLPMGGGKGGSDFDPKGKSDNEVRRFCQAFMGELYRHIGQFVDVPAGDIGVGGREIGFLYGSYKRVTNSNTQGILTGKALEFGGSHIRPEATGYGLIYFANECLKANGMSMQGKRCVVSGSGNVAQYAAQKILQLGGKVLTLSDSSGFIVENDPAGITAEGLQFVMNLKNVKRGRISEYINFSKTAVYTGNGARPWGVVTDYAFPCATQNGLCVCVCVCVRAT